jgi:hypothetical protein
MNINLKCFYIVKETTNSEKRQPTKEKKVFENLTSDKKLISKILPKNAYKWPTGI